MTDSNISKFNRLVIGVVVAALIAASCGTDEPDVVQPRAETAATVAEQPTTTVEEAVANTDTDSSPEDDEELAPTTTAAVEASEPEPEPKPVQAAAPSLVVDPVTVPEGLNTFTLEGSGFDPGLTTWTLLCPLEPSLSEETPEEELVAAMGAVAEADCDLSSAREAVIDDDGTFSVQRDAIVNPQNFMWVASDADQTRVAAAAVFVSTEEPEQTSTDVPPAAEPSDEPEPVDQPASTTVPQATEPEAGPEPDAETTSTETTPPDASVDPLAGETETDSLEPDTGPDPAPEPEPATTSTPPEPEQEPEDEPVLAEDDPWARVWYEPVLAAELWPEGDRDGNPFPEDDLFCQVIDEATFPDGDNCWYEAEPEPEPEPERGTVWVPPEAGMVPVVHPDVPSTEWQRGPVNPRDRAYDKPRTTEAVQEWRDWCYPRWGGNCEGMEHEMYQALDYLGASETCVLNAYTKRAEYFLRHRSGADSSFATDNYGWHLCATVIDPIVKDIPDGQRENDVGLRLSDRPGITLAERCRIVLTTPFPDIQLETRPTFGDIAAGIPPARFGQDCDRWATDVIENGLGTSAPACNESSSLAEEWMEHHHNQHELYHRPHC